MSVYAFAVASITPGIGAADATTLTASTYMAVQGGTSTQLSSVDEVIMGGLAGSTTAPMIMLLARDSTVMGTPTALSSPNSNGPLHPLAGVLTAPAIGAITATTQSQRSNSVSLPKKAYAFNAYGGVFRANYANTKDRFAIYGNAASLGEFSLSAFTGSTGGAAMSMEIDYETE